MSKVNRGAIVFAFLGMACGGGDNVAASPDAYTNMVDAHPSDGGPPDAFAGTDAFVGTDAFAPDASMQADAGPPCRTDLPFQAPTLIASLASPMAEGSLVLTADELQAFFHSDRAGSSNFDIWMASRSSRTESFGTPVRVDALSGMTAEYSPSLTADGLTIYFDRQGAELEVWTASRSSLTSPFGAPTLAQLPAGFGNVQPLPGGFLAVDVVNRDFVFLTDPGPVPVPPVPQVDLNTAEQEWSLALAPDQTTLYFSSNRAGGSGQRDIYSARRTATGWTDVRRVVELSTPADDLPNAISADGCRLYLHSDRASPGVYEFYLAERPTL